jgi:hypothetical protein
MKEQLRRLVAARVQLWFPEGDRERMVNDTIVREWMQMWSPDDDGRQGFLWEERVVLSEDYFHSIQRHGVPLSMTALRAIRHSPLALDVYQWLAYRLRRIDKPEGVFVPWDGENGLHRQFGQEVADRHKFRTTFRNALRLAQGVYPAAGAAVVEEDGGLRLFKATPPIPETTTPDQIAAERRQLLKEAQQKAAEARAAIDAQHRAKASVLERKRRRKKSGYSPPPRGRASTD